MTSEFDSISAYSEWTAKLDELLIAARAATEQSEEARLAVARRLLDFVARSQPASPEMSRLDQLATEAARALATHGASESARRIAERSPLLESLAADLRSIRENADASTQVSQASLAEFTNRLAVAATEAAAIVRASLEPRSDPVVLRIRIDRLAALVAELQRAFGAPNSRASEPSDPASGTVLPSGLRAAP